MVILLCAGENQTFSHGGSATRLATYGRLMTPRSPGGNAFESAGDSDEEGTEPADEDDFLFGDENIDGSADLLNVSAFLVLILVFFFFNFSVCRYHCLYNTQWLSKVVSTTFIFEHIRFALLLSLRVYHL